MVFVCQAKMFSIFKTVLLFSIVLVAFILHEINADKNRQNTCDGSHGKCGLFKTVETDYGAIRGRVEKSLIHQKKYYSFKGIPYAKEPTGELRFKAPQAAEPWKPNTLNALEFGSGCVQSADFFKMPNEEEEENCLFLNVFTPDIKPVEKLPVMFYIHGGAFIEGSANDYFGADFLIEQNVILVTINYRLGVFGFMSLGLPEYSGNMGLKDQQLALKWVNQNIDRFGGDRTKVTIFGHSAGSASVHLQLLSPVSRNLFQRAILMSGTALNRWALSEEDDHMFDMFAITSDVEKLATNEVELIEYLKTADADELLEHTDYPLNSIDDNERKITLKWKPIIEKNDAIEPFLTEEPETIYKTEQLNIDTMFGFASDEWLGFGISDMENPTALKKFDENFFLQLPFRGNEFEYQSKEYKLLADEIRRFYFGEDNAIDNGTLTEYIDLLSDVHFVYGIDRGVKLHASKSHGKTYYYRFSVNAELNTGSFLYEQRLPGACHSDELCYLFRCSFLSSQYDDMLNDGETNVSYRTIKNMTKLWTNFAKFGNPINNNDPIEEFKPIENNIIHFLDISNDGLTTGMGPHKKSMDFWQNIHQKYEQLREQNKNKISDEL